VDALMAALVAAALAQIGDRTPWLAAILADRYRQPWLVIAMAALAMFAAGAIAAAAAALIATRMTPEAKQLFLALALLLQGAGSLTAAKAPDRLPGWRLGAALTSAIGLFILGFGDGIQLIVLAFAARTSVPWFAAVGAALGSLAVITPAAMLGEAAWLALPLRPARLVIAIGFVVAGIWLGLSAVALI
jgi:putative Ca2+/H+ antiporter (TMEM165/GDT1 family)